MATAETSTGTALMGKKMEQANLTAVGPEVVELADRAQRGDVTDTKSHVEQQLLLLLQQSPSLRAAIGDPDQWSLEAVQRVSSPDKESPPLLAVTVSVRSAASQTLKLAVRPVEEVSNKMKLTEGGMGMVQVMLLDNQPVVIKVLKEARTADGEDGSEEFAREAALLVRIAGNGSPRLLGGGQVNGMPFLAIELVRGGISLVELYAEFQKRGERPPPDFVRALAYKCAVAIQRLHSTHNILHLDLKLENFVLDEDGEIWIIDFGLSRARDDDRTQRGGFAGTLRTASPELLERGPGAADERTDLYAIAADMYTLLTGEVLVSPEERRKRMIRGESQEIDVSGRMEQAEAIDPELKEALEWPLRYDTGLRPKSAGEWLNGSKKKKIPGVAKLGKKQAKRWPTRGKKESTEATETNFSVWGEDKATATSNLADALIQTYRRKKRPGPVAIASAAATVVAGAVASLWYAFQKKPPAEGQGGVVIEEQPDREVSYHFGDDKVKRKRTNYDGKLEGLRIDTPGTGGSVMVMRNHRTGTRVDAKNGRDRAMIWDLAPMELTSFRSIVGRKGEPTTQMKTPLYGITVGNALVAFVPDEGYIVMVDSETPGENGAFRTFATAEECRNFLEQAGLLTALSTMEFDRVGAPTVEDDPGKWEEVEGEGKAKAQSEIMKALDHLKGSTVVPAAAPRKGIDREPLPSETRTTAIGTGMQLGAPLPSMLPHAWPSLQTIWFSAATDPKVDAARIAVEKLDLETLPVAILEELAPVEQAYQAAETAKDTAKKVSLALEILWILYKVARLTVRTQTGSWY